MRDEVWWENRVDMKSIPTDDRSLAEIVAFVGARRAADFMSALPFNPYQGFVNAPFNGASGKSGIAPGHRHAADFMSA